MPLVDEFIDDVGVDKYQAIKLIQVGTASYY